MLQLITSADGSHTLLNTEMNETYHSTKGALQESIHVFIKSGLELFSKKEQVSILEIGFGTGLNALLTLEYAMNHQEKIAYTTLEPFPVDFSLVEQMNYPELMQSSELKNAFEAMHLLAFGQREKYNVYFTFIKEKQKLEEYPITPDVFDLIYYDAFAPSKQPEVWDVENMRKCYTGLKQGGILVSYCASGQFKRNLKEVGFTVETLEGPPGKKEMTRASKL